MILCERLIYIYKNERWFMVESSKCYKIDVEIEERGEFW